MSLHIDVVVDNAGALARFVNDLEAMKKEAVSAAGGLDKMSVSEKAHHENLSKLQAQLSASTIDLIKFAEAAIAADKALAGMKIVKSPFSSMESDLKKLKPILKDVNKEIRAANNLNKEKLGNSGYMKMVTEAKAALLLQEKLNVEVEKQAKLLSEIAMLKKSPGSINVVSHSAVPLKEAQVQTAALEKQLISEQKLSALRQLESQGVKTLAINNKSLTAAKKAELLVNKGLASSYDSSLKLKMLQTEEQAKYARESMKGIQAAEKMLGVERNTAVESGRLKTAMEAEAIATKKAAVAKAAYNRQRMSGTKSAATLIGVPDYDNSKLTSQMKNDGLMIEKQQKAVNKLRERFAALNKQKLPIEKVRALNTELHTLGKSLAGGSLQSSGIVKASRDLHGMETTLGKSKVAAVDWGKSMKFAIGGVARSMGAMTYSYSMLAPLIAGMAIGAGIKKVYELGAAFEYTTAYVDALRESVDGLNIDNLRDSLLGFEGLRKGPNELASGMKEFSKAGIEASAALGDIEEMSKFATIAELDLGEATKLIIGQSNAFGESFSDAANIVSKAALSSSTDIGEMVKGMSQLTELSSISKASLTDVSTAMAVLANRGIKGSKAATAIRTAVIKMQAPTENIKKILEGINWRAFTDKGQIKDIRTMFIELKRVTDLMSPEKKISFEKDLFGLRALKGGANLIAAAGDEYDAMRVKIEGATGAGKSFISGVFDKLDDTVTAKLEKLGATFQASLIKAFDSEGTKRVLNNFQDLIASDEFITSLKTVVSGINTIGSAISGLLSTSSKLPIGITEGGLIGYILFGANPIAKTMAMLVLADKAAHGIAESATGKKAMSIPDIYTRSSDFSQYEADLLVGDRKGMLYYLTMYDKLNVLTDAQTEKLKELNTELEKNNGLFLERNWRGVIQLKAVKVKVKIENPKVVSVDIESIDSQISKLMNQNTTFDFTAFNDIGAELNDIDTYVVKDLNKELSTLIKNGTTLDNWRAIDNITAKIADIEQLKNKYKELNDVLALRRAAGNPEVNPEVASALSKISLQQQIKGMTAFEKAMYEAEQQAIKTGASFSTALSPDSFGVGKIEDSLKAGVLTDSLKKLQDQIDGFNVTSVVNALKGIRDPSMKIFNNLRSEFASLSAQQAKMWENAGPKKGDFGFEAFEKKATEAFKGAIAASGMFQTALKNSKAQVESLRNSLSDMKFGFVSDLNSIRSKLLPENQRKGFKYKQDFSEIARLKKMSKEAGKAGVAGREREVELLKQAYAIAKSIDTSNATGGGDNKSKVRQQYAVMAGLQKQLTNLKKDDIKRSEDQAKKVTDYFEKVKQGLSSSVTSFGLAKEKAQGYGKVIAENQKLTVDWMNVSIGDIRRVADEYAKLKKAAGGSTPMTGKEVVGMGTKPSGVSKDAIDSYAKAKNEVEKYSKAVITSGDRVLTWSNGAIVETRKVKKAYNELKDASKVVIPTSFANTEFFTKVKDGLSGVSEGYTNVSDTATGYGEVVGANSDAIVGWGNTTTKEIMKAVKAYQELKRAAGEVVPPKTSAIGTPSARAFGGPVTRGTEYLVGEKGPEMFTPSRSGFIIPNNQIQKGGSTVNVNFTFPGNNQVQLQGSKENVDSLLRALADKQRYAA